MFFLEDYIQWKQIHSLYGWGFYCVNSAACFEIFFWSFRWPSSWILDNKICKKRIFRIDWSLVKDRNFKEKRRYSAYVKAIKGICVDVEEKGVFKNLRSQKVKRSYQILKFQKKQKNFFLFQETKSHKDFKDGEQ